MFTLERMAIQPQKGTKREIEQPLCDFSIFRKGLLLSYGHSRNELQRAFLCCSNRLQHAHVLFDWKPLNWLDFLVLLPSVATTSLLRFHLQA